MSVLLLIFCWIFLTYGISCVGTLILLIFEFFVNIKTYRSGCNVVAIVDGYFFNTYYSYRSIHAECSPVVTFLNSDNMNVTVQIKNYFIFPIYRRGKKLRIKYIKTGIDDVIPCEFYTDRNMKEKKDFNTYLNYNCVLFDFKYFLFLFFSIGFSLTFSLFIMFVL